MTTVLDAYKDKTASLEECEKAYLKQVESIADLTIRPTIAGIIANQWSYNKSQSNNVMPEYIKQLSIPGQIHFLACLPHEIISLQAMRTDPDDFFFLNKAGDKESLERCVLNCNHQAVAAVRIMEKGIPAEDLIMSCMDVAISMTEEACYHINLEIMSNAEKFYGEFSGKDDILKLIDVGRQTVKNKIGRAANFVVMPPALARAVRDCLTAEYDFEGLPTNIRRIGYLSNDMVLFINGHERSRILVGYKGVSQFDAGYLYAPQILFCDPTKQKDRYIIHARYISQVTNPDYFCVIHLHSNAIKAKDKSLF